MACLIDINILISVSWSWTPANTRRVKLILILSLTELAPDSQEERHGTHIIDEIQH